MYTRLATSDDGLECSKECDNLVAVKFLAPDNDDAEKVGSSNAVALSSTKSVMIVGILTAAILINSFSAQAMVIILPSIGKDLEIPEGRLQWVISGNALSWGCLMLFWGRAADVYGSRRIFIFNSLVVAATSALNPLITNEIGFEVVRALQGIGSAAISPTAAGILGTMFPAGKARAYAFGVYAAGSPLGAISGNLLSGLITELYSWKWVFLSVALFSASIAALALIVIPSSAQNRPGKICSQGEQSLDWLGSCLVTVGLCALLVALSEVGVLGWANLWIVLSMVLSAVLLSSFAIREHHLEKCGKHPPLVRPSILRNAGIGAGILLMGLCHSSYSGFLIYATYFFQNYQGLSPMQTALRFIPDGVAGVVAAITTPYILSKLGSRKVLAIGALCVSMASLLFAVPITAHTNYFSAAFPAIILSVVGANIVWPTLMLFMSQSLPETDQALGGALINAAGRLGRAIALPLATSIQARVMARERGVDVINVGSMRVGDAATVAGIRAGAWFNCGLGIASILVVILGMRGCDMSRCVSQKEREDEVAHV